MYKTSLSNLFRHIERRQALIDGQVEILVDRTRIAGEDFGTAALPATRVFNRDAIDRNIFEVVDQQLPPVFFLGEDSVEKQKKIEDLKKQLEAKVQDGSRWDRKTSDAASALDSFCSEEAKGITRSRNLSETSALGRWHRPTQRLHTFATASDERKNVRTKGVLIYSGRRPGWHPNLAVFDAGISSRPTCVARDHSINCVD